MFVVAVADSSWNWLRRNSGGVAVGWDVRVLAVGQLTLFALVVHLALVAEARIISSPHGAAVLASLRSSVPNCV